MFTMIKTPRLIGLALALTTGACAGEIGDGNGDDNYSEEGNSEAGNSAGYGAAHSAAFETVHAAELLASLPNNYPLPNLHGTAATFSTAGEVAQDGAFFTPQGTNGRSCASCHTPNDGWTISAATLQKRFDETGGLDPVFNLLDADRPNAFANMEALKAASVDERRAAFTMLLQGKFTRKQTVAATTEFEVIEVSDPFGVSTPTALQFFRRSMPTANFRNHLVSWDGGNTVGTDLHAGLSRQARGNITGAQQGVAPADETVVQEIVNYEKSLSHAQVTVGDLYLGSNGAKGGPEHLSKQPLVDGRFDLFDAWLDSRSPRRARIARGQELFNNGKEGQGSCRGCHSAANDGQSAIGSMQNIGASRPELANKDMAVFTLRNKVTGEILKTTDGGKGWKTGLWRDLQRFKTPSLRGVASRGAYFHNGLATSLREVVRHYESTLGFSFTDSERSDLVEFLKAL